MFITRAINSNIVFLISVIYKIILIDRPTYQDNSNNYMPDHIFRNKATPRRSSK